MQAVYNSAWKYSRGLVDYAITVSVDEFIGPNLLQNLELCKTLGATVILPQGYHIITEKYQPPHFPCRGVLDHNYSKPAIIDPNKIEHLDYAPGCHTAKFIGQVNRLESDQLKLLHYRYLGREETWQRYQELNEKRRAEDKRLGFGSQYGHGREEYDHIFDQFLQNAIELK
jgi:hypothetical protein